jgi:hypothetical protein
MEWSKLRSEIKANLWISIRLAKEHLGNLLFKCSSYSNLRFRRNSIALAALFLAAKVEEQPRKLEHVIKMAHICLVGRDAPPLDIRSDSYQVNRQSDVEVFFNLVNYENENLSLIRNR